MKKPKGLRSNDAMPPKKYRDAVAKKSKRGGKSHGMGNAGQMYKY